MKYLLLFGALLCALDVSAQNTSIVPGGVWRDTEGHQIQAHGGSILHVGEAFYWYGEVYQSPRDTVYHRVSCYSSHDLMNWTFRGYVFQMQSPDTALHDWVLERPKVYHNARTGKYVMYMHLDGRIEKRDYGYAEVGVAVSDAPTGPFRFVRHFRPLGQESRDIGQFIDDDGTAYLIFEDRFAMGFHIAKLSPDYMDVERDVAFIHQPMEGGALVHYGGLYYVIGSALTGWTPNPNKYATAPSLSGPWSTFRDVAPPATNTYRSQSGLMMKIVGTKATTVIFFGDRWNADTLWDSRYVWMPLRIGNGTLELPEPRPWTIDLTTGEWSESATHGVTGSVK